MEALTLALLVAVTPPTMSRDDLVTRAQPAVGYSYWWGNGAWRTDDAQHGHCSGSCPSCSHSGRYGADCSGYVAKIWQVPSASAVTSNAHPYSTYDFTCTTAHWSHISRGSVTKGDALSYRSGGCPGSGGHVVMFDHGDPWGSMWVFEAKGCSYGIQHDNRTISSSYKASKRQNLGAACTPHPETCNGVDDNCDGHADEGGACDDRDEAVYGASMFDAAANTPDIDGDGIADVCARAAAGVRCALSGGGTFATAVSGPELSNANGWDDVANYSTLRLGDVTGDGLADLCARSNSGVTCWPSTGTGFGAAIAGPTLSDASGWSKPEYYSTLRLADVNGDGKADVCARGAAGFRCYPSTGAGFGNTITTDFYANDDGFGDADKYGTIRMADIDGDGRVDVCARETQGMTCHLSQGDGFGPAIPGPAWSDAAGFDDVSQWSTIRAGDVNGDGRADLCARKASGMVCHLSTGVSFSDEIVGPALADGHGWSGADNYKTIRLADVNGDNRLDICARANAQLDCWPALVDGAGIRFGEAIAGPAFFSDAAGFNDAGQYRTIRIADVNGDHRADVCGRDADGFSCFLSDPSVAGGGFTTRIDGPRWSTASGWGALKYAGTIVLSSSQACIPSPEVCDGEDNDCSGAVDDNGACVDESGAGIDEPAPPPTHASTVPGGAAPLHRFPPPPADGGCSSGGGDAPGAVAGVAIVLALLRRRRRLSVCPLRAYEEPR